ncbi:PCBAB, partial [Symbiodinium sp. CCMP2456]
EDFDVASVTTRHSYFSEGVPDKAHILYPPNRILHDRHARLFEGRLKELSTFTGMFKLKQDVELHREMLSESKSVQFATMPC